MSTTAHPRFALHRPKRVESGPHPLLRPFVIATILLAVAVLGVGLTREWSTLLSRADELALWVVVAAAVGLAAVTFLSGSSLGLDAPLLIAAAMMFGPTAAGLIAFVGYVDRREFRGEVRIERALFNRAQIALSVMAGGAAFSIAGGFREGMPRFLIAALLAVALDMAVNWALVVIVRVLHEGVSFAEAIAGSHTGRTSDFFIGYLTFGLLSAAIAEAYESAGIWTLAIFGLVAVLGRKTFETSHSLDLARVALRQRDAELLRVSERVAEERRDERLAVAAGLHDEVLPPLFKVHLLGQVVKQDLATGRLLDLDADVPELIASTEAASESMRRLIGSLRSSPIGAHGLRGTLELLCEQLAEESGIPITTDIDEVDAAPTVQLLAYQVGREALRNAIEHSRASRIDVVLTTTDDAVRLIVGDDGEGFVHSLVDQDSHFGLQLIRDRVELFGGTLVVDSTPGSGTRIVVRLPFERRND